jgi:hypothetical protein
MQRGVPRGTLGVVDCLIPLVRRLESVVDACRASDAGTAERALAQDEVARIRRRIAALPIDREARSAVGSPGEVRVPRPFVSGRAALWRRSTAISTVTRR